MNHLSCQVLFERNYRHIKTIRLDFTQTHCNSLTTELLDQMFQIPFFSIQSLEHFGH